MKAKLLLMSAVFLTSTTLSPVMADGSTKSGATAADFITKGQDRVKHREEVYNSSFRLSEDTESLLGQLVGGTTLIGGAVVVAGIGVSAVATILTGGVILVAPLVVFGAAAGTRKLYKEIRKNIDPFCTRPRAVFLDFDQLEKVFTGDLKEGSKKYKRSHGHLTTVSYCLLKRSKKDESQPAHPNYTKYMLKTCEQKRHTDKKFCAFVKNAVNNYDAILDIAAKNADKISPANVDNLNAALEDETTK